MKTLRNTAQAARRATSDRLDVTLSFSIGALFTHVTWLFALSAGGAA